MGKIKRIFCAFASFLLLCANFCGMMPTYAAENNNIINPESVEPNQDGVVLSKTATAVDGMVNTWDITLKIEAPKIQNSSDTVVVIDTSNSMSGSRLIEAKKAAKALIGMLLPVDGESANHVAVIAFNDDIRQNTSGFTNNRSELERFIDGLTAVKDTFTPGAMHAATELIESSSAEIKNIVFLSDGQPTKGYEIKNNDRRDEYFGEITESNDEVYLADSARKGQLIGKLETLSGVDKGDYDYDHTSNGRREDVWSMFRGGRYNKKDFYYNFGNEAIDEARYYKELGIGDLYTIDLQSGTAGEYVLTRMASSSEHYSSATTESLVSIFERIGGKIVEKIDSAYVEDAMGDGIVISNGSSIGTAGASSLKWAPNFQYNAESGKYVAEVTYRVEATDEVLNYLDDDGYASLNKRATITYDGNNTADFPVPKAKPMTVSITKQLVGQTCAGCEFDIELTYPGGTVKTYRVKDGETKTIAGGLKIGNYSINEVGTVNNDVALENYLINYSQKTFAINKNRVNPVKITVTNTYETTNVNAKKVWDDDNDRDGFRAGFTDLSMAVKDGDRIVAHETIDVTKNEQEFVFTGLPKYRNGIEIQYKVVEAIKCATRCIEYHGDKMHGYRIEENDDNVVITNKHIPERIHLTVKKHWDVEAGKLPTSMPAFITVTLSNNENDSVRTIELTGNGYGEWTSAPIEVLKYKNGGELIQYEVKEVKIGNNMLGGDNQDTLYVYNGEKLEGKWTASYAGALDVKNTWTPATSVYLDKGGYIIKKIDENGKPMQGVIFTVGKAFYFTDENGEAHVKVHTPSNSASGSYTFDIHETSTLEGYDLITEHETMKVKTTSNWAEVDEENLLNIYEKEYEFEPTGAPGYVWNNGMYIVTNKRSTAKSLTIKKIFSGVNAEALKDVTFTVTGPADFGNNGEMVLKFADDCTVSGNEATCVVNTKVPTGEYSVKENNAELEYFTLEVSGDDGTSKEVKKGDETVFTINNKYDVDETSYVVTKVWDDNDDQDGKRPDELTIKLKADGKTVDTLKITSEDMVEGQDNAWTYTWNEIPVASVDGKKISYTVKEVLDTDDYEQSGFESDEYSATITNTHEPELINNDDDDEDNDGKLVITKQWEDGNDELNTRPSAITVYLYANDTKIDSATISPDEVGDWTYVFEGLYKYSNGKEITYSIKEAYVDGYKAEINDESTIDGFTITNTSTNPCAFGGCGNTVVVYTTPTLMAPETGAIAKTDRDESTTESMIVRVAISGLVAVLAIVGWLALGEKNRGKVDKIA